MLFYSISEISNVRYKGGTIMAEINNENKVEGVFGGVEFGTQEQDQKEQLENIEGITGDLETPEQNVFKKIETNNLPTKPSLWSKIKNTLFTNVSFKIELTPYQQKVENEINEFLHQEISFKGFFSSNKKTKT